MYIYPTVQPYRISSKFGMRIHPVTKVQRFHNGVDIACPVGTFLKNTVSKGKCVKVGFDDLNGNYLRIEHDNGLMTSYAHLSKVIVKEGNDVSLGEVFALTGNTGLGTGAHVHFRVRQLDGLVYKDVNPEKFFTFSPDLT
jgi:murein DD-endopeptidase